MGDWRETRRMAHMGMEALEDRSAQPKEAHLNLYYGSP
jgi:hypothetical protein